MLALLVLLPGSAAATHVQCGDVITQDTTLDTDLIDCPGDGVVIGAGDVTLDLGGHTIDGTGTDAGNQGVEINASDNVTVVNGRIQQFLAAVSIRLAGANDVSGMTLAESSIGVYLERASSTRIEDNEMLGPGPGVLLFLRGSFNEIRRNSISGASTGIFLLGAVPVTADVAAHNVVADNRVFDNTTGLSLTGPHDTLVTGNQFTHNAVEGVLEHAVRSRIQGNVVRRNGVGVSVANSHLAQVTENRTWDNEGDGVRLGPDADRATLADNFAKGNADDGIDVDSPSATLIRNKAIHNGDYGIEAVPGVTDGGGNKAHANGNRAQCLNISCR